MLEFKIPTHPDASGIGTSSAEICIWPLDRLLPGSCARPVKTGRSAPREASLAADEGSDNPVTTFGTHAAAHRKSIPGAASCDRSLLRATPVKCSNANMLAAKMHVQFSNFNICQNLARVGKIQTKFGFDIAENEPCKNLPDRAVQQPSRTVKSAQRTPSGLRHAPSRSGRDLDVQAL